MLVGEIFAVVPESQFGHAGEWLCLPGIDDRAGRGPGVLNFRDRQDAVVEREAGAGGIILLGIAGIVLDRAAAENSAEDGDGIGRMSAEANAQRRKRIRRPASGK